MKCNMLKFLPSNKAGGKKEKYRKGRKNKMNKKLLLLPLSALLVFMMAGLVSAAVTCSFDQTATTIGTRSTYITGTAFNISATAIGQTGKQNITWGNLTNSKTSTVYKFNASDAENVSQVNASVYTREFLDTDSVTFTWTIGNISLDTLATCTRTYIADNTVPSCSFASTFKSSTTYAPEQKWTATCNNASSANIQFGSNSVLSMTELSDSCTFTGDRFKVPEGVYRTVVVRTSDELNGTSCSLSSISIDSGVPLEEIAAITASGGKASFGGKAPVSGKSNNNVYIIAVIGVAAYLYVKSKKK